MDALEIVKLKTAILVCLMQVYGEIQTPRELLEIARGIFADIGLP